MPKRDENGHVIISDVNEDGTAFNGNWWAFLPMAAIAGFALLIGFIALAESVMSVLISIIRAIAG